MNETERDVPPEIAAVVTAWRNKLEEIDAVDEQLADRDKRIREFSTTLAELNASHRALGMQRTELMLSAERLRVMAEQGCRHERLPLPTVQDALPAPTSTDPAPQPPSTPTGPAGLIEDALTSGQMSVLGDPTVTRVDDPDGGEEPDQGPFHRGGSRRR